MKMVIIVTVIVSIIIITTVIVNISLFAVLLIIIKMKSKMNDVEDETVTIIIPEMARTR